MFQLLRVHRQVGEGVLYVDQDKLSAPPASLLFHRDRGVKMVHRSDGFHSVHCLRQDDLLLQSCFGVSSASPKVYNEPPLLGAVSSCFHDDGQLRDRPLGEVFVYFLPGELHSIPQVDNPRHLFFGVGDVLRDAAVVGYGASGDLQARVDHHFLLEFFVGRWEHPFGFDVQVDAQGGSVFNPIRQHGVGVPCFSSPCPDDVCFQWGLVNPPGREVDLGFALAANELPEFSLPSRHGPLVQGAVLRAVGARRL